MAEVIGVGMFHGPHPALTDESMASVYFRRNLAHPDTPDALKDPSSWPEALRAEWADDQAVAAARRHRAEALEGARRAREVIDAFAPDVVVMFADDQYENFKEDLIPPFCVYAADEFPVASFVDAVPHTGSTKAGPEALDHPPVQQEVRGSRSIGTRLANELVGGGYDVACSWRLHHMSRLGHAFSHSVDYLDWDRRGFPYRVVPFHVSCYGADLKVPEAGVPAPVGRLGPARDPAPPDAPTPARCYDLGRQVAEILEQSPYRTVIIGSASWSHASLTAVHGHLWPDVDADRACLDQLRDGKFAAWRDLDAARLHASGQHEMRNWICLAGAMEGRQADVLAWAETHVFNSSKCVAVFR